MVGPIIVTAPPGGEDLVRGSIELLGLGDSATVITGGATRAESVALALAVAELELIVIHDAARPLVTGELIDRIVGRLAEERDADGVIAAVPLADTVKRGQASRADERAGGKAQTIAETLDRDALWGAQTPQAFRTDALRRAGAAAATRGELELATDEARLIELDGGTVLLEPTTAGNLKVTTAGDLAAAEALLSGPR
jgi:2-C-methyl-D-erythritol 4-phosphate cytidylyltransferase